MREWIVAYDDDGNEEVHDGLVRCKDCKYSESTTDAHGEPYPFLICTACESIAVEHNDYCSKGEERMTESCPNGEKR